MFTHGRVADPLTVADIAITLALAAEVALDRTPGLLGEIERVRAALRAVQIVLTGFAAPRPSLSASQALMISFPRSPGRRTSLLGSIYRRGTATRTPLTVQISPRS